MFKQLFNQMKAPNDIATTTSASIVTTSPNASVITALPPTATTTTTTAVNTTALTSKRNRKMNHFFNFLYNMNNIFRFLFTNAGKMESNAAIDLSEIEQIVKEKTEQHEEKSKSRKPNFDLNNSGSSSSGDGGGSGGGGGGSGADVVASETNGRGAEYDPRHSNNSSEDNNKENGQKSIESALTKRESSLNELIETEKRYIENLDVLVNGYMAEMNNPNSPIPLPDDLRDGKGRVVFGNVGAIYEWHRDNFLKALLRCREHPTELGPTIKRYDAKFRMYIVYTQNKDLSDHIVSENEVYFNQIRLRIEQTRQRSDATEIRGPYNDFLRSSSRSIYINDLLIAPVQRLTKYELIFKEIISHSETAGMHREAEAISEALDLMKKYVHAINDMMVLRRLQKFDDKITAQGALLRHGKLNCYEDARNASERNTAILSKPRELQVFLFQQSIIFADIMYKKSQYTLPTYTYRSQILVNKMKLEELPNNRFLLKSTDPNRPEVRMICSAETPEQNQKWLNTIHNILDAQKRFLDALSRPIDHQKQQHKEQ